ncbi:MAG TPA: sodium:proton exchanger [Firmicutes bacterium]|nr:sodium:proton exchanger [Bacillota bacterium]
MRSKLLLGAAVVGVALLLPELAFASEGAEGGHHLVTSIGISIIVATVLAFIANTFKQPLLLAYIIAGVVIGPHMGFHLIENRGDIETIAEIGLILLLFMIGLEIDIKKLRESGSSLIVSGVTQFMICFALGIGFFFMIGFTLSNMQFSVLGFEIGGAGYDLGYLAVCTAISSTTIVVKLLYEKFELDTLPGRITLGILVFQDLWAIVILGIQPNLADPQILQILWSFGKGGILVVIALLISRYTLGKLFKSIAKAPELVLVASLGWCFFICGIASVFDLSLEMGALIAGAAISTFPYNLDVIAKIVSIRDFFLTLFFVALGMQIPNPLDNPGIVAIAALASVFVVLSRFIAVFPVLWGLRNGNRVSLLVPINLAQISEFALVIASLGFGAGHISQDTLSIVIFIFAITSITSTYMIKFSHPLQQMFNNLIQKIGIKDIEDAPTEGPVDAAKDIAILGFFRVASSLVREIIDHEPQLAERIVVVDFNPNVHQKLQAMGIKAIYGDVANMDTLHHAGIEHAKIVISTIPDTILKGTDNLRMIKSIQRICPHARIIVTAESASRAVKMYQDGADYVFLPRILAAEHLIPVVNDLIERDDESLKETQMDILKAREEIIS